MGFISPPSRLSTPLPNPSWSLQDLPPLSFFASSLLSPVALPMTPFSPVIPPSGGVDGVRGVCGGGRVHPLGVADQSPGDPQGGHIQRQEGI